MINTRWKLLFFLLPFICLPVFAGEVNVKKLNSRDWITMESTNFRVFSDGNEKTAVLMLEELENFNYFMALLMGYERRILERKIPVILAKNRSSFASMGISDEYAGLFLSREGGIIFARADRFKASADGGSNWGRSVVLHELVHYLMNSASLGLASPPWFNEGVAEYFGTFVQKKDKIIVGDMSLLRNRFYSLLLPAGARFESVNSEALFKTTQEELNIKDELSRKESRFLDKFYARSVSVVHYLNADPARRENMYRFLFALNKGYSVDEAFPVIFGKTFKEFDAEVDDYITGKFVMARTFPRGKEGIQFPPVAAKKIILNQQESMSFLYVNIALLPENFLGRKDREDMENGFAELYPDFFK